MSLTEQLNDLKQQLGQEIPRERFWMDIGQFVQGLVQSGIEKTSCQAGDKAPTLLLSCLMFPGKWFPLMRYIIQGACMVLSFYRWHMVTVL